jgi:hypothetical protein
LSIPGGLAAAIAAAREIPKKLARANMLIQTLIPLSIEGAASTAWSERCSYDTLICGRK